MRNINLTLTVYDYRDREIVVEATVSPPVAGKYEGPWENCYPSEPAEILDIEATWAESGVMLSDVELTILVDNDAVIEAAMEQMDEEETRDY